MLLTPKTFNDEKVRLYHEQQGLCKLCRRELNPDITSNHLDHDHELHGENAGRVRGLLCNFCNSLEGQIKHKFNSSGLRTRGIELSEWLQELCHYYAMDITGNSIHPKFIPDKVKWFKRLNKDEMIQEMEQRQFSYDSNMTKDALINSYKKQLRVLYKSLSTQQ